MTKEMKLLQAAMDGNTAAFEKIVKKYQSLICAITFSGTGRVDISEELAQETFLSAWKNLRQLKELSGFRPWLCTIARNILNNHYRKKKTVPLDPAHLADLSDQAPTPSDNLISQEEHVMLEQALMQIPAEYREPLVMFYRQEKSIREVAVGLGLNESTVQTRLHRARQMLREEIAARLERTLERTAPDKTFTKAVMAGIGATLAVGAAGTASAAVAATGAAGAGTGASTGIAAVMSTVTAKVITAAAVAAIAVGAVFVYRHLSQSEQPPVQSDGIAVVQEEQELFVTHEDVKSTLPDIQETVADQTNSAPESGLASLASVPDAIEDNQTDLVVTGEMGLRDGESVMNQIISMGLVVDKSLDGKKAVVRIYDNWKDNPEAFRTEEIEIKNRKVNFDSLKLDPNSVNIDDPGGVPVVALFGPDQTDPNVAESMTNYVCANTYQKNLEFSLPGSSYDKRHIVFNDASPGNAMFDCYGPISIGLPIPEANVKVYLVSNSKARICLGEYKTNSGGSFVVPYTDKYNSNNRLKYFDFIISQPDYGIAKVSDYNYPNGTVASISLPLVKSDSELVRRTARGYLVDTEGSPVAGAEISCSSVRTLGEGLINSSESNNRTILTSDDGSFRLYVLSRDRTTERGSLVPPKSTYNLRFEPPAQTDLLPFFSALVNDQEHIITMNRGDVLRHFAFYDEEGLITDSEKLQTLNIYVKSPEEPEQITLYYDHIKDGAYVPYGTYRAVMYYQGQETEFRPVEISTDSDELVVFDLPDVLEYHGRVIDGITGKAMQDIIVFAQNGGKQKSLAELTDQEWDVLHFGNPDSDNMFAPLDECYNIKQIIQTNTNGEYTMRFRKGDVYGIYAVEQYFLPVMQRDMNLVVDEDNRCEIPTLKLFPAAKLVFTITAENPVEAYKGDMTVRSDVIFSGDVPYIDMQVWPWWSISPAGNPEWIPSLLKCDNRQDKFIQYAKWMRPSEGECLLFVPADTSLTVRLDPSSDTLSPMHLDVSPLQQGQVKDMGEIIFSSRFQIALKIVDSQGNPREGVPLRRKISSNGWDVVHNSDENGLVYFHVDPHSTNTFGIFYHGGSKPRSETIDIETTTSQETPKEFTMVVSDEMLQLLFD